MLGDISLVFYVNDEGNLAYLWYKGTESGASPPAYESRTVLLNSNPIGLDKETPQVTAVAYYSNDQFHLRVYYLSDKGLLREAGVDPPSAESNYDWFDGQLNKLNLKADPAARLTALAQVGGVNQLKVFYKANGEPDFRVAYANIGGSNWSNRDCFDTK